MGPVETWGKGRDRLRRVTDCCVLSFPATEAVPARSRMEPFTFKAQKWLLIQCHRIFPVCPFEREAWAGVEGGRQGPANDGALPREGGAKRDHTTLNAQNPDVGVEYKSQQAA